jgi:hypothetical protein
MSAQATKKYRPYMSLAEMQTLQVLLGNHLQAADGVNRTKENLSLFRYLERYIEDIEGEIKTPSVIVAAPIQKPVTKAKIDPVSLYDSYQESGMGVFSPEEKATLEEYMYVNKLFTPEQAKHYEQKLFQI